MKIANFGLASWPDVPTPEDGRTEKPRLRRHNPRVGIMNEICHADHHVRQDVVGTALGRSVKGMFPAPASGGSALLLVNGARLWVPDRSRYRPQDLASRRQPWIFPANLWEAARQTEQVALRKKTGTIRRSVRIV